MLGPSAGDQPTEPILLHTAIDSSAQTHLNSRKNLQGHREKGKEVARAESRTENLDKFYKDGSIEIKTKVAEEETCIQ